MVPSHQQYPVGSHVQLAPSGQLRGSSGVHSPIGWQ
jgi:hypothetical protein